MTKLLSCLAVAFVASLTATLGGCDMYTGGHHHGGGGGNSPGGPGGGSGYQCGSNTDCAAGCYCAGGVCNEGGFCASDADCGPGFICDLKRSSCQPIDQPPPPPPGFCGNGVLDPGEQCDDGNLVNGDGCSDKCLKEAPSSCVGQPTEAACVAAGCTPLFTASGCVDASGATCAVGAMGCSCSTYTYATCEATPPPPAPVCGNGILEAGEQCDDGNLVNGDGCSAKCLLEPKISCNAAITCNLGPPTCPADQVPTIQSGCWDGGCRPIAQCDVPPTCTVINTEASCLARMDCGPIYSGSNCTSPTGQSCTAGSSNCTCATFTFSSCTSNTL